MSAETVHKGTRRGVLIALVAIAVFVAGIAMLGNKSAPADDPAATQDN